MEKRRFLNTYEIKNVSDCDIEFEITLHSGIVIQETFKANAIVKGLTHNAKSHFKTFIELGSIQCIQEYEIYKEHNWIKEGF